jgi:hypothetical protein
MYKSFFAEQFVICDLMSKNAMQLDSTQMIINYGTFIFMLVR